MENENVQNIDPEKLKNWQNGSRSESPEGGFSNSESGAPGELDGLEMQELISRQKRTLNVLQKVGNKVVDMVDNQAKKVGRPGIGDDQFREDYVEIGMVWVEQMAGRPGEREKIIEFLKKAPGYTFGALTLGILTRNGLSFAGKDGNNNSEKSSENNGE